MPNNDRRSSQGRSQQGGGKSYGPKRGTSGGAGTGSGGGRGSGSGKGSGGGKGTGGARPRTYDHRARREEPPPRPRKPWTPDSGQLPKWVSDELARVTQKGRLAAATDALMEAATFFAAGKYGKSLAAAEEAKQLSSRDATVREILALSAYRLGRWDVALRELRTFRRLTGEATHMPVEMDVLRALGRPKDVEEVWKTFHKMDPGMRETAREAKVVFGSFLLDQGDARRAWEVTNPKKMGANPEESELRVWYVASKAAAELGDIATARQLFEAIERADTAFPGLDELGRLLRND